MTTSFIERNSSIAYLGLLITVAGLFVLPWLLPIPPVLSIGIGIFGFVLTLYEGRGIHSLIAGGLVAWSVFVLLLANTATSEAPDLEEPIPVPSGYGFKLDPDSTNAEHTYDSQPMPPRQAQFAVVEVVDYYVNRLEPGWTVVSRQEMPQNLRVQLRQGDTSRAIGISVSVVTPEGRPAVLVLHIRTLLCGEDVPGLAPGEVGCWAAPVSKLVRYPGGGPVSDSEPSTGPLREPVPLPPGYEFVLNPAASSEQLHVYDSTIYMSPLEAHRGERAVMRYYRHTLHDWTIVEADDANLLVKDPGSTDGLAIRAYSLGAHVTVEIRNIYCPEDYWCNWAPAG